MKMSRVPAVIIAVIIGGAGLSACGGGGSGTPTAAGSGTGSGGSSASAPATGSSGSGTGSSTSPTSPASTTPMSTASNNPANNVVPTGSAAAASGGTHNFTVPAISGDNIVTAYGSYTKLGSDRVKVKICAEQTGAAYAIGAIALAYNSSGASKNVGAVVLLGPGNTSCGTQYFLFYTAHLKVHAFIGHNGTIVKTGPVLTLY